VNHLDDTILLDLALGTGDHPHLAACPACSAALAATLDAVHLLALGLPPAPPPPELRVRLLAAVAGPLTAHAPRVAELLDLAPDLVARALARVHAGDAPWVAVLPGIDVYTLHTAGPRECGILRAAPGGTFPYHRHLGEERVLVLQGSCVDSSGRQLGPGDEIHHGPGTAHHLEIHPGPALVFAYVSDGSDFAALP
jgi:anti-sigma factor ChrR (cupin superfamily)